MVTLDDNFRAGRVALPLKCLLPVAATVGEGVVFDVPNAVCKRS